MRPRALLLALALAATTTLARQAGGQDGGQEGPAPATLVADRVEIDAEGRLVASGKVEALQGDTRLTAARIVYDSGSGGLSIEGPIAITEGGGRTILLADAAELSPDLREGLLRSARLVLDRQLQLAAAEISRTQGRFTQLSKVVASSCEVCAANPVPLWQIRASRIVHDTEERQLYFDNARFEVYGVPLVYLPRLRLPDPTVERATGFLVPRFTRTDKLGFGIKTPYFFALSESRDLTLTPYVSARSVTMEGRYRQAFRKGELQFDGAVSRDDIRPGETRGYLFGAGGFRLPRGYRLRFNVEYASDGDYLDDYGYSSANRLTNAVILGRAERDLLLGAETIYYYVPGADLDEELRPALVSDALWVRRFSPPGIGGIGTVRFLAHGHQRPSDKDVSGRDVGRLEAGIDWRGDTVLAGGMVFAAGGSLLAQYDEYADDSANPDPEMRLIPTAAAELRWPFVRQGASASHVIEPVAQLVWTGDAALTDRPAEESLQVAFDEGNLFSFSRFPAGDRVEAGLRANLGLGYTLHDPGNWSLDLLAGRVLRADDEGQFDGIASLDGTRSDWLVGASLDLASGFRLDGRALIDDDLAANLLETQLAWQGERLDVAGGYTWLEPSPEEQRPDAINQWRIDGALRVNERWRASADVIYDLDRDRAADAIFGVEYRANCVTVDVGLRQRYTAPDQTDPSTTIDFQLALAGFGGTSDGPRPRNRACLR